MDSFERCKTCPVRLAGGAGEANEQNVVCVMEEEDCSTKSSKRLAEDTYMRFRYSSDTPKELGFDDKMTNLQNSAECLLQNKFGACTTFLVIEAIAALEQTK